MALTPTSRWSSLLSTRILSAVPLVAFTALLLAVPPLLHAQDPGGDAQQATDATTPAEATNADEAGAEASTGDGAAAPKLQGFLEELGLAYAQPQENVYRVALETDGEASIVVVEGRVASWSYADEPVRYAYLWTQITPSYPSDARLPAALYKRIAELNDTYLFVSIGTAKSGADTEAVFATTTFFERAADVGVLGDYLFLLHQARTELRKELVPFLQE